MKNDQCILVVTHTGNLTGPFENCIQSIGDVDYPIRTFVNQEHDSRYELGGLLYTLKNTDFEEIFLMQDTVEVKDNSIFDILFEENRGRSIYYSTLGQCYLNKYLRSVLDHMEIPLARTKEEAIKLESTFHKEYTSMSKLLKIPLNQNFSGVFKDATYARMEEKFGRNNKVLEDDYLIKYKGTWK